jgi:hypothetical protein
MTKLPHDNCGQIESASCLSQTLYQRWKNFIEGKI